MAKTIHSQGNPVPRGAADLDRRRFLKTVGLGVGAGVVLTACGSAAVTTTTAAASGTTAAPGTTGAPIEISWAVPPIFRFQYDGVSELDSPSQWPEQAAAAFMAARPDVTVATQVIPWDIWAQRRTAALTQGPAPDLMYRVGPDVVNSGLVVPVDDLFTDDDRSDLQPAGIEAMTFGGNLYGYPWLANPAILAINRSLVEQKGALDLLPDENTPRDLFWPQYLELMKAVSGDEPTYGLGVAAGHMAAVIFWMMGAWMHQWGAKTWENESEERYILHEQDATYDALETYVGMVKDGTMAPGITKWEDVDQLWYRNQLLSRGHWASVDTELEVAVSAGTAEPFDIYYTQFPRVESVPAKADQSTEGNMFPATGRDDAARQAAFDFARFLGRDPGAQRGIAGNGFFPVSLGGADASIDLFAPKPQYQWILGEVMALPSIPSWARGPQRNPDTIELWAKSDVNSLYYATWESIVTLQRTPVEAMKELGDRVNAAIGA